MTKTFAIGYNVSMLDVILANVTGSIPRHVCEVLEKLASRVPSNGAILDLNCGEGRSTMIMALALEAKSKDCLVMAVDTHIQNPFSETPYQEGSALNFLTNTRRFRLAHRIVPIICPVDMAGRVVGKRCANLIVVQSPGTIHGPYAEDSLCQSIEVAKGAARRGAVVAIICPNAAYQRQFDTLVDRQCSSFEQISNTPEIKVFEII